MRVPVGGSQPWVMGVVNVTPDSFSDGGRFLDAEAAVARGLELVADGADLIDIGGESTRPGAHRIDVATELGRVIPVIRGLAARGVLCSIDTSRAEVAQAAIAAGAAIVNDVSGGLGDDRMSAVVADARVPWIIMHWRGPSDVMDSLATYRDVAHEVRDELLARVDAAVAAGVDPRSLIIDPGLGFAKTAAHNWEVLRHLELLTDLGLPVLIGASRKRFLGELLCAADGGLRPAAGREAATAAVSLLAARAGLWGVRVHEVLPTVDALAVYGAADPHAHGDAGPKGAGAVDAAAPLADVDVAGPLAAHRHSTVSYGEQLGRISLTGLTVRGFHGVFDHEKRDGQDFVIDVTVWRDIAAAAATDDLTETLNYAELADAVVTIVSGPPRDLIETVVTEIADTIVARWDLGAVEVTLHKPHAPIDAQFTDVSVTVRRDGRQPVAESV